MAKLNHSFWHRAVASFAAPWAVWAAACDETTMVDWDRVNAGAAGAPAVEATPVQVSDATSPSEPGGRSSSNTWHPVEASDAAYVKPDCAPIDPCSAGEPVTDPELVKLAGAGQCVRTVVRLRDGNVRQVTALPNGDLMAVTQSGEIRRYRDLDCDGAFDTRAPEQITWAYTGGSANNVALDAEHGVLFAASPGGVSRFSYCEDQDAGSPVLEIEGMASCPESSSVTIEDGQLLVSSEHEHVVRRFSVAALLDSAKPLHWADGEIARSGEAETCAYVTSAGATRAGAHTSFIARGDAILRVSDVRGEVD
jgi:hypothetical protein